MKRFVYFYIILCIFSISIFGKQLEKVSLQLHWKYQFEFAGFIAAKEKGFYKDVGLDVELKEYQIGMNIVDEILSGHSTYGIYNSNLLMSYMQGKPIKLLASFFKRSALVIITQPEISTIKDLKNKTIMATTKDDFDLNFKYLFNENDIDTNTLKLIPHTYDIQTFIDRKCDAMTAFISDQPYKLDKQHAKYNIIDPSKYGLYNLQLELFTSQKEVQKHPLRAKLFKEASIKGWKYALTHKKEIIQIIQKKYNPNLTYDFLQNEAKQTELLILPKIYPIGLIDIEFLQKQFELYSKQIKTKKTLSNFLVTPRDNIVSLLTDEEKIYLQNKKSLTVCIKKEWLPYEGYKNGQFIGISADFLHMYAKKLNLKLQYIVTNTQIDSLKLLKNQRCDIKPLLVHNNIKTIPYKYTIPYFHDNISLVTRLEQGYIQDLKYIKKTLVVSKGFDRFILFLKKEYPNIKIKPVEDTKVALDMVAHSKAFGYIGTSLTSSYLIQKRYSTKLKIANSFKEISFGFGIVKTEPHLKNILNKLIKNTTEEEKNKIFNKWIVTTVQKDIDYSVIIYIIIFLILIIIIVIFDLYKERKFNHILEKKIEEALKQNKIQHQQLLHQSRFAQMGEMIGNIAHQWRQPLNAIGIMMMKLEFLNEKKYNNSQELQKIANDTNTSLEFMSKTIDDFRSFFASNKHKENFIVQDTINDALSIIQIQLDTLGIKLIIEQNKKAEVYGYKNELTQVVLNILSNAKDAIKSNKLTNNSKSYFIRISIEVEKEYINIHIEDNAGGIKDNIISKIFDPYFTTKFQSNGTGIGLYMSKIIVEQNMGGDLYVKNSKEGAIFTIKIKKKS